jgi:ADP-heptose:LPS heptosyltransferase
VAVAGAPPTLVVLRALGVGDLLTAVPALRALAAAFPHHRRVLAAPAALAPLVELIDDRHGSPVVHEVRDTAPLEPLDRSLHGADVAVNLHGRGPESHRLILDGSPARLIAWRHGALPDSETVPRWRAGEHEVARWCRLLEEEGIPADAGALDLRPPPVAVPAIARGATVIHPGAADAARRWPSERWAAVARSERLRGRRVVITGSDAERPLAHRVAAQARLGADAVLAGATDLAGLAAVIAAAGRVACGDTGAAHLATALGTPSVVLFGPTPPAEWGPPRERTRHRVLWAGTRSDPHAESPDPGLLRIGPGAVSAALARLPSGRPYAARGGE